MCSVKNQGTDKVIVLRRLSIGLPHKEVSIMHSRFVKRPFLVYLLFLLVLSLICACKPHPVSTALPTPTLDWLDPGLTLESCFPPCWLELQPGITSLQEAKTILNKYSEKGLISGWQETSIGECPDSTWSQIFSVLGSNPPAWGTYFAIAFKNEQVYSIAIEPPENWRTYTLGQLVDLHGFPEFVTDYDLGDCYNCDIVYRESERVIGLRVYYPSKGMQFALTADSQLQGCMCPDMVVENAYYFVPVSTDRFRDLLMPWDVSSSDSLRCQSEFKACCDNDVVEWHGFGGGY